jgi:hypothetical protein
MHPSAKFLVPKPSVRDSRLGCRRPTTRFPHGLQTPHHGIPAWVALAPPRDSRMGCRRPTTGIGGFPHGLHWPHHGYRGIAAWAADAPPRDCRMGCRRLTTGLRGIAAVVARASPSQSLTISTPHHIKASSRPPRRQEEQSHPLETTISRGRNVEKVLMASSFKNQFSRAQ